MREHAHLRSELETAIFEAQDLYCDRVEAGLDVATSLSPSQMHWLEKTQNVGMPQLPDDADITEFFDGPTRFPTEALFDSQNEVMRAFEIMARDIFNEREAILNHAASQMPHELEHVEAMHHFGYSDIRFGVEFTQRRAESLSYRPFVRALSMPRVVPKIMSSAVGVAPAEPSEGDLLALGNYGYRDKADVAARLAQDQFRSLPGVDAVLKQMMA